MKLDEIKAELKSKLSEHRYKHTESVVETALAYADIFTDLLADNDKEKIEIAAWLHDRCKELSNEEQVELAKFYGVEVFEEDLAAPNLLHARVGAAFVEEEYEIYDPVILHAIRDHTLGSIDMHPASKILYLADMLEPLRDNGPKAKPEYKAELNVIRSIINEEKNLDKALLAAMDSKINYVLQKGQMVHPLGVMARNSLL